MKYLVKNAAISIDGKYILNDINFEILDNSHIGIVGKNGSGKTTLLRGLINNDLFEEGIEDDILKIEKIGNFTIGYQEQVTFDNENISLLDEINKSFVNIINLHNKIDILAKKMTDNCSDEIIKEYSEALDRFDFLGGYSYKKDYEIMLNKFGFTEEDKFKNISDFSGGERTKIAFIKLLLAKPDILFLDEPTNHLDIETIKWLEAYLSGYKGAFVLVSHDRMFLNNIVNTIYDITNGKVNKYIGNYEHYERQRLEDYEKQLKDYEKQQKEIERLRQLYEKFRFKPTKASMAMSKLHMIEKMKLIDKPEKIDDRSFRTNLDKVEPSSKIVLTCKDLKIGYDRELAKISFEITKGKRIGIIGANGTGKSTLLKTICKKIKPLGGNIAYGYHVNVGYFDQTLAMINSSNTVLEEFMESHSELSEKEARSALGAFLFRGEDVKTNINALSGGEKVRLELCKILYNKPNFLVLDEPTNHMDIIGKKRLEDILLQYKGTILFVSHDRYFVKKIATDLIVFENKQVKYYQCGYDDYMEKYVLDNIVKVSNDKKKKKNLVMANNNDYKKKLSKLEQEILELEAKKSDLINELNNSEVFCDYIKANTINNNICEIDSSLYELNIKWNELVSKVIND